MDEKEELIESKFEKIDEQDDIHTAYAKLYKVSEKHEKMYKLASKKLSDVELEQEELSTKFDEANLQVILSLSSLSSCFCFCITCVFCFYFELI